MKKWILLTITLIVLIAGALFFNSFKLKEIQVTGCQTVDEQTVINVIKSNKYSDNTLTLYMYNKFKKIDNIPFVSKLDIEFEGKNKVIVTVYEKSIAGCVEYMNDYVFFDKDGIILESSSTPIANVPCIKGLSFDSWEMGEKLPIDDPGKFQSILSITQLIEKYELTIDAIKFTNENEIELFYENIIIELGNGDNLPVQMMNLGSILEGLEGMSGVLYMKDFDSENATASFIRSDE